MPKPRRHTRRTAADWSAILARFESSGLTARSFCRREKLSLSSFQRWRSRCGAVQTAEFVELVPAPTIATAASEWTLDIALPGGVHLRFRG